MKSVPKYKLTRRMFSKLLKHELLSQQERQMYRKLSRQYLNSAFGQQVYVITLMLTLKERERRFTHFLNKQAS